jgi:hypothetical protein
MRPLILLAVSTFVTQIGRNTFITSAVSMCAIATPPNTGLT